MSVEFLCSVENNKQATFGCPTFFSISTFYKISLLLINIELFCFINIYLNAVSNFCCSLPVLSCHILLLTLIALEPGCGNVFGYKQEFSRLEFPRSRNIESAFFPNRFCKFSPAFDQSVSLFRIYVNFRLNPQFSFLFYSKAFYTRFRKTFETYCRTFAQATCSFQLLGLAI